MSHKSSLPQVTQSVSGALPPDRGKGEEGSGAEERLG